MPSEARGWVDAFLASSHGVEDLHATPKHLQVAVLKECVRRMPLLRSDDDYAAGSALYELACDLYRRKLPFEEQDVCVLLETSRHTCGHGSDVSPPLDIAQAWMQGNGYSQRIIDAIRVFVASLKGVGSTQANLAKRRSAILLLADPETGSEAGWSEHFRAGLRAMNASHCTAWQGFVLNMKANDVYVPPAVWKKHARKLIADVGASVVLEQIARWVAVGVEPASAVVRTAASHVLKHLVWLIDEISADESFVSQCDDIAALVARTDWTPKDRAAKVLIAVEHYFRRRRQAVGERRQPPTRR